MKEDGEEEKNVMDEPNWERYIPMKTLKNKHKQVKERRKREKIENEIRNHISVSYRERITFLREILVCKGL
jgi:hypothetical protein